MPTHIFAVLQDDLPSLLELLDERIELVVVGEDVVSACEQESCTLFSGSNLVDAVAIVSSQVDNLLKVVSGSDSEHPVSGGSGVKELALQNMEGMS